MFLIPMLSSRVGQASVNASSDPPKELCFRPAESSRTAFGHKWATEFRVLSFGTDFVDDAGVLLRTFHAMVSRSSLLHVCC